MVQSWNPRGLVSRLLVIGAALMTWSCGGAGTTAPATTGTTTTTTTGTTTSNTATTNSVSVDDDFFQPSATTVAVGTTVTWTWIGSIGHNVTFDDGPHSATQASGTYTRTFAAAGTYKYHCTIHGVAMSGTVTVQ